MELVQQKWNEILEAVQKELESSNGKKRPSISKIKKICTNKKITSSRISIKQRTGGASR